MTAPRDLDALIADGEIEVDPVQARRARMAALWVEADAAIRRDVEYTIAIAQEMHRAIASAADSEARRERGRYAGQRSAEARVAREMSTER